MRELATIAESAVAQVLEVPAEDSLVARVEGLTAVAVLRRPVLLPHEVPHVGWPLRLHWRVEAVGLVVLLGRLIKLCHCVGLLSCLITSVTVLLSWLLLVNRLLI